MYNRPEYIKILSVGTASGLFFGYGGKNKGGVV
jgi:hypothetical protein